MKDYCSSLDYCCACFSVFDGLQLPIYTTGPRYDSKDGGVFFMTMSNLEVSENTTVVIIANDAVLHGTDVAYIAAAQQPPSCAH
jgi:hypothetical protein